MKRLLPWANAHPQIVGALAEARREKIACGLFSGFHAHIYGLRPTADLDIFTYPDHFSRLCELLRRSFPEVAHQLRTNEAVTMHGADGALIHFAADEFTTTADQGMPVQVVRPRSPVYVDGRECDLSLTDLAARALQPRVVGGWVINGVPLPETIATKALFQRGGAGSTKHDTEDIAGLAPYLTPADKAYLLQRTGPGECNFGPREYEFLGAAGLGPAAPGRRELSMAA